MFVAKVLLQIEEFTSGFVKDFYLTIKELPINIIHRTHIGFVRHTTNGYKKPFHYFRYYFGVVRSLTFVDKSIVALTEILVIFSLQTSWVIRQVKVPTFGVQRIDSLANVFPYLHLFPFV